MGEVGRKWRISSFIKITRLRGAGGGRRKILGAKIKFVVCLLVKKWLESEKKARENAKGRSNSMAFFLAASGSSLRERE